MKKIRKRNNLLKLPQNKRDLKLELKLSLVNLLQENSVEFFDGSSLRVMEALIIMKSFGSL